MHLERVSTGSGSDLVGRYHRRAHALDTHAKRAKTKTETSDESLEDQQILFPRKPPKRNILSLPETIT